MEDETEDDASPERPVELYRYLLKEDYSKMGVDVADLQGAIEIDQIGRAHV